MYWLKIEERIMYKWLILTFKAFIDRTAPLYLCELYLYIENHSYIRNMVYNIDTQ